MMEKMLSRGQELAADAQAQEIQRIAQRVRALFGAGAVSTEETRVLVSGRGMIKRWLIDPSLQFLGGGLK